jgi:hypothetical protein
MLPGHILIAFLSALVFTALFGVLFGVRDRIPELVMVFVLLFLFAWAGAAWIGPAGPALLGVYWLPGVVVTVLIFLLLAVFARSGPPRTTREARAELEAVQTAARFFGIAIWILIAGLVLAIIIAYLL